MAPNQTKTPDQSMQNEIIAYNVKRVDYVNKTTKKQVIGTAIEFLQPTLGRDAQGQKKLEWVGGKAFLKDENCPANLREGVLRVEWGFRPVTLPTGQAVQVQVLSRVTEWIADRPF